MYLILVVGIIGLYCGLCWYILTHHTERRSGSVRNLSQKRLRNLKSSISERETRHKLSQIIAIANLMRLIPWIGYNKDREEQIRVLLSAVDKRDENGRLIIPEEIYLKQLLVAGGIIGVGFVLSVMMHPMLVLAAIAIAPIAMRFVLTDMQDEQNVISNAVSSQFLPFYKVYYVQFIRKDVTSTLANVVQSFIPQADQNFKKVLSRFLSDLDSGEEYALAQLDSRFPTNAKVHKFVTVAKARNKGDEACFDSMRAFLNEMEDQQDAFYDNDLRNRLSKIEQLVMAYLMLSFGVIMTVMIATMALSGS